ncbi:MAG: DUF1698 domain-containing protein, partial [Opitutales bacterium]|nr:DUF1698 domain-containing protein [Opitutales bacterium]
MTFRLFVIRKRRYTRTIPRLGDSGWLPAEESEWTFLYATLEGPNIVTLWKWPTALEPHRETPRLPKNHPAWVIPFGIEQLPPSLPVFDTVFSMGVLYHRRSPLDHLIELREMLKPGGELVLETLVVEGEDGHALMPRGRYA